MIRKRNNKPLMKDDKYILNCEHRHYNMYYQCHLTDHLHCIRCGKILLQNIRLSKTLSTSTIYKSHKTCDHLTNHLINFDCN